MSWATKGFGTLAGFGFLASFWVVFLLGDLRAAGTFALILVAHLAAFRPTAGGPMLPLSLPRPGDIRAQFTDLPLLLPVAIAWAMAPVLRDGTTGPGAAAGGLLVGLAVFVAVSVLALAGRLAVPAARALAIRVIHVADGAVTAVGRRVAVALDLVRAALAVGSVGALQAAVAGLPFGSAAWLVLGFVLLALAAAAVLGWAGWASVRTMTETARPRARRLIAADLRRVPVRALLYAGSEARVLDEPEAALDLLAALTAEGMATGVVVSNERATPVFAGVHVSHVWRAPIIANLDAFSQPLIEAVFYVDNDPTNVHFTPKRELVHVMVATGELARRERLPRSIASFDAVVAPDVLHARRWRAALPDNLAERVVLLGDEPEAGEIPLYAGYRELVAALKGEAQ